jgi:hypothetical protein
MPAISRWDLIQGLKGYFITIDVLTFLVAALSTPQLLF